MNSLYKLAALATLLSTVACADDLSLDGDDDAPGTPDAGGNTPPVGKPDAGQKPDGGSTLPDGGESLCGNRVIDQGEQCDDGNVVSGDGCTSGCLLESAVEGDVCPGREILLTQEGSTLRGAVSGTTVGAYNQYGSACGGGSGPDVVYTFTPTTSGKAVVRFGADYLGIVSARATCDDTNSESTCGALTTAGTETTFEFPVFAGMPAFLHVDGYAGTAGTFDIQVDISLAACGNGVAELPERCDDGNTTDGDGCSATCELESGGLLSQCPGQPFVMSGVAGQPRVVSFTANTLVDGASNANAPGSFFSTGNEVVYAVLPDVDGSAHVVLTAGYRRPTLHTRRECGVSSYQTDTAVANAVGATTELELPVSAGEWFYVFVDADRDDGGPFVATVTVTPRACGNGRLDAGEGCDDGNVLDGDGCSATCQLQDAAEAETCAGAPIALTDDAGVLRGAVSGTIVGKTQKVPPCNDQYTDSYVISGGVEMPSSSMPGDAIYAVTPTMDGRMRVELHDTFHGVVGILSDAPCTLRDPKNGAGKLPNVLGCSNGGRSPHNLNPDPYAIEGLSGDKVAFAPVVAGHQYFVVVDSFSSKSTQAGEGPFTLQLEVQPGVCGNGVLDAAEACDDGNTNAGDGCDASCALESNPPNTCATARELVFTETGPGSFAAVASSSTLQLTGNQDFGSSATNAGICSAPGPDAYFKIVAPAAGVLRVRAHSDAFDAVLGLRSTCSLNTRPLACANGGGVGSEELLVRSVQANEELFVIVDSPSFPAYAYCGTPTSGAAWCDSLVARGLFDLDVQLAPPTCGDGLYTGGAEQCDDGNLIDGDGCSATCTSEALANVDTCPGHALALTQVAGGYRGRVTVDTSGLAANYSGACGGSGRDGVIRVVAPITGTLRASTTNHDGVTLHARAVCTDPATEFPKVSSGTTCPNVVHDAVTFQVTATDEYYLFVDGLSGESGPANLEVTVTP